MSQICNSLMSLSSPQRFRHFAMANEVAVAGPSAALEAEALIEKAWYVLTLLLRIGHPTKPAEIAFRFGAAPASTELLEYLCRIPGSPLFLTEGGFVTVSAAVAAAFEGLLVGGSPRRVPRFPAVFAGLKKMWSVEDVFWRYSSRKRKEGCLFPKAKRRALLTHGNEELEAGDCSRCFLPLRTVIECAFAVEIQAVPETKSRNSFPVNVATMEHASGIVEERGSLTLPLLTYDAAVSHGVEMKYDATRCIDVNMYSGSAVSTKYQSCALDTQPEGNKAASLVTSAADHISMTTQMFLCDEMNPMDSVSLQNHKRQSLEESGNHGFSEEGPIAKVLVDEWVEDQAKVELVSLGASTNAIGILAAPALKMAAVATPLSSELFNTRKEEILLNKPANRIPSNVQIEELEAENINRSKKKLTDVQEGRKFLLKKSRSQNNKMPKKENKCMVSKDPKNNVESKKFPDFESFILEEEEGSGGYGTVYRARRKNDGKTFAVKCPHPNAHLYHVYNELKMLERFGGRNFIIKYEGSFKSGKSECFVLEHVEHDRPEVLKKEIAVSELQWYGFCLFRALSSLHKQGIVHRDVKPGNFLFSRKLNKGYLIDFNLALDLNHRHRAGGKLYANSHKSSEQIAFKFTKPMSSAKARKPATGRTLEVFSKEPAKKADKGAGKALVSKFVNKAASKCPEGFLDFESRNKYGIQVADGSGITSAKDVTSTRTPSADKLREPIPCCGRKELINLVQEVMQSPSQNALPTPVSQRKRIAAPLGKVERQLAFLTPMPLLSNGIAVSTSEKKHKNEGPCVGTKGFRAPEVLLKSIHQSCKIDMWSAGVTILYLMLGRTPFGGDPEQNIKEIAKLRGSEDLWEVAKLHNRESSFPMDLYDIHSLQAMKLRDWCEKNTKRPDFIYQIPSSLFDLVEKCLTVNPRLRINADDALMHDFLSPCRDSLRKQRMLRLNAGLEIGSQSQ